MPLFKRYLIFTCFTISLSGCTFSKSILGAVMVQRSCDGIRNEINRLDCQRQVKDKIDYYKNKEKTASKHELNRVNN